MNYALVVITHGEATHLERALDAWLDMCQPDPDIISVFADGPSRVIRRPALHTNGSPSQLGFCGNTHRAWQWASGSPYPYVAWLEHDFLVTKHVDLAPLAAVLDEHRTLAQMQLMRDAVNDQEKAAGGLFESRPGQYQQRFTDFSFTSNAYPHLVHRYPYLVHRSYFTTNVNLMRRKFMADNPWPDPAVVAERCEGVFGIELVDRGYSFGVWGSGEPWTQHVGERDGTGFGY